MVNSAPSSNSNNDAAPALNASTTGASVVANLIDDSSFAAPHHTITSDDDEAGSTTDDDDASTNVGSLSDRPAEASSDLKSTQPQQIRVTDYDEDEEDLDDAQTLQAGSSGYSGADLKRATSSFKDDIEASHPSGPHQGPVDDDLADEYQTSLLGTAGFVDRRGTPSRRTSRSVFSRFWEIAREALPTLIVAVLSLMFSGELLVHLARWPVFQKVDKLFILIPILLNMKGNLEMNLSLRMSTSANIGELDVRRTRETLIRGNLALLQVQAMIVSMFAGVLAFVLGVVTPEPQVEAPAAPVPVTPQQQTPENALIQTIVRSAISAVTLRNRRRALPASAGATTKAAGWLQPRRIIHHHPKPPTDPALRLRNGYFEFALVIATAVLSASISSAVLGSFMCGLVVIARRAGANPDNIASPLASSLGDLTTLTLLGLLASSLAHFEGTFLATVILAAMALACVASFIVTYRNAYVRELLTSGWVPLLMAMFISSGAGLVLDNFVGRYEGFALLTPVIIGLPGACAAIFASRITTALHSGKGATLLRAASKAGDAGAGYGGVLVSTRAVLCIPPIEGWLVPISLLIMGVGTKTAFIIAIRASGQMVFGWTFGLAFVGAAVAADFFALYLAHVICLTLWSRDYDPDIYCLPFVSSIVDVVGQSLLVMAFTVATGLGDHITAAVNAGAGHGGA